LILAAGRVHRPQQRAALEHGKLFQVSSRNRTGKAARARHQTQDHAGRGRLRDPGLRDVCDALIESLRTLTNPAEVADAYDAELVMSVVLGTFLEAGASDDFLITAMLYLVAELARCDQPHGYLALRVLAAVGPPEIAEPAAQAAEVIDAAGDQADQLPDWLGDLGKVTLEGCLVYTDAYRELQMVLLEFAYPGGRRPHAISATLDATWHGAVTQLLVTDPPAGTRKMMEKRARRNGGELHEIGAEQAAGIAAALLGGIAAFRKNGPGPDIEGDRDHFVLMCSSVWLSRRRAAALAGHDTAPGPTVAERWPGSGSGCHPAAALPAGSARRGGRLRRGTLPGHRAPDLRRPRTGPARRRYRRSDR